MSAVVHGNQGRTLANRVPAEVVTQVRALAGPGGRYHDRHTVLRSPKRPSLADELAGTPSQSQIQRLFAELGVEATRPIHPKRKAGSSALGALSNAWLGQTLQLRVRSGDPPLARKAVTVQVVPEGDLFVYAGKHRQADQVCEPVHAQLIEPATESVPTHRPPRCTITPGQRAWLFGSPS